MKKQFRRAGALMLALLMLMTAAPALAEDVPSAADGTQIEEIIGEEPAVTEAPTAIPTEIPTEAPTNTPNPTEIPTEAPTNTPNPTGIPTETPTETPIQTEIPTEEPTNCMRTAASTSTTWKARNCCATGPARTGPIRQADERGPAPAPLPPAARHPAGAGFGLAATPPASCPKSTTGRSATVSAGA